VETSLSIARGMTAGLDRLHYEGIIHRDVKPFNVMLAEDQGGPGTVKLIDFGLSKLRGEPTVRHKGMVVGSPYYAAPEQEADPESADERSDLYSVGVTLYRMLTGRLPNEKGASSIREIHADLDHAWDDFFATALARDPAARFPDGPAMLDALDELETRWLRQRDATCAAPDLLAEPEPPETCPPPRSEPLKAGLRQGRAAFDLDELWRPECYAHGDFADQNNGTVLERTRGLVWERHGSRYPLSWERANAHVARLNKNGYAGRTDWRLPTVAELATLFTGRTEPGEFCLEPAFDPQKARLWSADRKAFTAAWYVDAELGFVWWQDLTCRFFARAVAG
jgi:serine/threonine-protein kinase